MNHFIKVLSISSLVIAGYLYQCSTAIGTETSSGTIAGIVMDKSQKPINGAAIYLHNPDSMSTDTTTSDAHGAFSFKSIPFGDFYLEVGAGDTSGALVEVSIDKESNKIKLDTIVAKAYGTITGSIDKALLGDSITSIYIVALDRVVAIDSAGNFTVDKVPESDYTLRLKSEKDFVTSPLDTIVVPVTEEDTAKVENVGAAAGSQIPLDSGLVGFYRFSGNAADSSRWLNDGVVYGATLTTDRFGNANSAYAFDGVSDYIEVPYHTSLDCEDSITVLLWAKSDLTGSAITTNSVILQMGEGSGKAYTMFLNAASNTMTFQYRSHAAPNSEGIMATTDGGIEHTLELDTVWHCYALTCNGTVLKSYVDGSYTDSTKAIAGVIEDLPLRFGVQSKALSLYWKGKIDDIRIYHRVLPAGDIMSLKSLTK